MRIPPKFKGTTKDQRKIGAVAINQMVIQMVPQQVKLMTYPLELHMLRETARALRVPNADTIN